MPEGAPAREDEVYTPRTSMHSAMENRERSLQAVEIYAPGGLEGGRRTMTRRIVIEEPSEALMSETRFAPTPKRGYSSKRTLTNRIRQLRETEHELNVYETLVSRCLKEAGIKQDDFDEKVEARTSAEVGVLHRMTTSDKGTWTPNERYVLASSLVKLAVWRIDPGAIDWTGKRARGLFVMAHDIRWRIFVKLCVCLYVVIIPFEAVRTSVAPKSGEMGATPWLWWVAMLEGVAALGYVMDVWICFGYQRRGAILELRQNYIRAFIAGSVSIDFFLALGVYSYTGGNVAYLRWSRPLRLLYLPFVDKAAYNSVLSILDTLPSLGDLLLLGLVFTFIWSIIGVSAFAPADLRSFGGDASNAFDSFDLAFVSLATLLTGENFPNVMWPALNFDPITALFFLVFVLVGTMMIMPATVAIVFEYYKRFHGLKVLEEKMVERRCLLMAFALVDEDNSGNISFQEFAKLAMAVHPRTSATERSLLYKLLDSDGSSTITAREFVRLSDVLLLAVTTESRYNSKRLRFLKWRDPRARAVTENPNFERVVLVIILVYVALLAVQAHPDLDVPGLTSSNLENLVDGVFVAVFAAEVVIKMAGQSIVGYFEDVWQRVDFFVIVVSVVMLIVKELLDVFAATSQLFAPARAIRILRVLRTIRTVSIFSHSNKLRSLTGLFVQMRPVILTILGTILMISYAYLVVGMEAFMGKASYDADQLATCGKFCSSFDSPFLGGITLLQLVLASNWSELFYLIHGDGGPFLTWFFFMSFVLLTNAIMLPLLSALILEIYSIETEKMVRRSNQNQLATLFPQDAKAWRVKGGVSSDKFVVVLSNGVRKMFENYDANQDGCISTVELGSLLTDLGEHLSNSELKNVLSSLDVDSNGQITFSEFMTWWQRHGLEKVFHRFDTDESGTIDAGELGLLMAEVGSPMNDIELAFALAELDKDNSGAITFDEYAAWFGDYDVRKVFASFDSDNSGVISRLELNGILAHMGFELKPDELKVALQRLDQDNDGGIDFDEFLPWWKDVQRSQEEKSFMVKNNRGIRWEENLFLRKRDDNGLSSMISGPDSHSNDTEARFVRAALIEQIAADFASGKDLSVEFLLDKYIDYGTKPALRNGTSSDQINAAVPGFGRTSRRSSEASSIGDGSNPSAIEAVGAAAELVRVTRGSGSRDSLAVARRSSDEQLQDRNAKFDAFPNVLNLTRLSPQRRSARASKAVRLSKEGVPGSNTFLNSADSDPLVPGSNPLVPGSNPLVPGSNPPADRRCKATSADATRNDSASSCTSQGTSYRASNFLAAGRDSLHRLSGVVNGSARSSRVEPETGTAEEAAAPTEDFDLSSPAVRRSRVGPELGDSHVDEGGPMSRAHGQSASAMHMGTIRYSSLDGSRRGALGEGA